MASGDARVMGTLSLVVFLRVLGVFLVLVGFTDHWTSLGGSLETSGVGFAAYALALALFLLPLGALSDRIGRGKVMVAALVVSAVGGVLAAVAATPWLFALGRFVQGMGAVNGVALAVAGEIGAPDARTRRMAVLGAAAGGGVVVGLLASAALHRLGVTIPQILMAFSMLTLATVPLVARVVPREGASEPYVRDPARVRLGLLLGIGGFAVNFSLAGLLLYSPQLLARAAPGVPYELALLVMLVPGGLGMFVTSRLADRGHARAVGVAAALVMAVAPLAFLGTPGVALVLIAGIMFFLGHSSLTSLLPSLASRHAVAGRRGLAQGVQSTMQYAGSAAGTSALGVLFARDLAPAMGAAFVVAGVVVAAVVALSTRSGEGARAAP